jgi:hypothetical protein
MMDEFSNDRENRNYVKFVGAKCIVSFSLKRLTVLDSNLHETVLDANRDRLLS